MRNDIYAVYDNSEYRIGARGDECVNLCSNDSNDLKKGFTLYEGVVYIKKVKVSQLQSVYSIKTYADYRGNKCQVLKEMDDKLLLHAILGDFNTFISLGFEMVDRGIYNKWVYIKDVEKIYEIKEKISI